MQHVTMTRGPLDIFQKHNPLKSENCGHNPEVISSAVRVRVTLRLTVSQSVSALSPSGTRDQILAVVKTVFPDGRTGLSCNRSQSLCW